MLFLCQISIGFWCVFFFSLLEGSDVFCGSCFRLVSGYELPDFSECCGTKGFLKRQEGCGVPDLVTLFQGSISPVPSREEKVSSLPITLLPHVLLGCESL